MNTLRQHNEKENDADFRAFTYWKIFENSTIKVENILKYGSNPNWRNDVVLFNEKTKDWKRYSEIFKSIKFEGFEILLKARVNIKTVEKELISLNDDEQSKNLMRLWFLLFGCEFIKNPAQIILVNMVLDIMEQNIESIRLDWATKINELLPMTKHLVLGEAMKLNDLYANYMPYPYRYQEEYTLKTDFEANLLKNEAGVFEKWLQEVHNEDRLVKELKKTDVPFDALSEIWKKVLDAFDSWQMGSLKHSSRFKELYHA